MDKSNAPELAPRSPSDDMHSHNHPSSDIVEPEPISTEPKVPKQRFEQAILEQAIKDNDLVELRKILEYDSNVLNSLLPYTLHEDDKAVTFDMAPLAFAAALAKHSVLELLLEYVATVDAEVPELGETALHLAARFGPKDSVSLLLSYNPDVNQPGRNGRSPLYLASRYGHLDIVACLLDAQADLDQRDNNGDTPFLVAAAYGKYEVLKFLLRKSTSRLNETNKHGLGPLHLACLNGRKSTVKWLLRMGAEIDQQAKNGATPLHCACERGSVKTLKLLLGSNADISKRDNLLQTPLLFSCFHAQPRIFRSLLDHNASVLDVNKFGFNGFHCLIAGEKEFSDDHKETLKSLVGAGCNINQANIGGKPPLLYACSKTNKAGHIKQLLDSGADINGGDILTGATALIAACCEADPSTVKIFLDRGADTTATNKHGLTALAIACVFGRLENARALLNHGVAVDAYDRDGFTALYTAIFNDHFDIALEIMATAKYFPKNPAREIAFIDCLPSLDRSEELEKKFLKNLEEINYQDQKRLPVILHWAITRGAGELVNWCVSHGRQVLEWEQCGATWLHVAAQYGKHELISLLRPKIIPYYEIDVSAKAKEDITALHVAARNGSVETTETLLRMISEQSRKVDAIVDQDGQGESPLTISIQQGNKHLEDLFWGEIRKLGKMDRNWIESNRKKAGDILELVARYETPGNEVILQELLQKWFPSENLQDRQDFTALHWAVHHSQAIVVWWLLSKGGYSNNTVKKVLKLPVLANKDDHSVQGRIKAILRDPPPIRIQVANPNNYPITPPPKPIDGNDEALDIKGNIVDIYSDGEMLSIPHASNISIRDIVYEKGPKSLMQEARGNLEQRSLETLKKLLSQTNAHEPSDSSSPRPRESLLKLRWIHLPVNDLHFMKDLVCRLSHDSERLEMDHAVLMKHLDRSWTELAAGGMLKYMKPRCVKKEIDYKNLSNSDRKKGRLAGENVTYTALYMPYLTIGRYPKEPKPEPTGSTELRHKPMTLDQYYYPAISDTKERDRDQVLSKFLDEEEPKTILMINQLWVWIIDKETIITATTDDPTSQSTQNMLQTTLQNVLYGEARSRFEHATSVQSVMRLVVGAATGSFMENSVLSQVSETSSTKKGPINIFRESIRNVVDDETSLFRDFLAGLKNKKGEHRGQHNRWSNRYHVISAETELLDQTRDIRDELNILKSLAEDQDTVWRQAFSDDDLTEHLLDHDSCTPTDVKRNLNEMLLEAESTTNYINTLLDLRQAEYSRIQSNSVFVFTVISVVFLPLSFLTSVFALNVSSFPHESGNVEYKAWWIFPMIFGLTIVVSIPAIALAWNSNIISDLFRLWNNSGRIERYPKAKPGRIAAVKRKIVENLVRFWDWMKQWRGETTLPS
ncbi:hypothetical protein F5B19DRAFT_443936 [Rostrohypoxylon terebratum]|nr:hypothetical protein F5B19DRAFT_443936 [Rostrohypoxylon terebratum]